MVQVYNINGDAMIGYVNSTGEYILTTPEE
jgi:hypothetical protein